MTAKLTPAEEGIKAAQFDARQSLPGYTTLTGLIRAHGGDREAAALESMAAALIESTWKELDRDHHRTRKETALIQLRSGIKSGQSQQFLLAVIDSLEEDSPTWEDDSPTWEEIAQIHRKASEERLEVIKQQRAEIKMLRESKDDLQARIEGLLEEVEAQAMEIAVYRR